VPGENTPAYLGIKELFNVEILKAFLNKCSSQFDLNLSFVLSGMLLKF